MSMLPMKKCLTCDHIFISPRFGKKITCPRCNSKAITEPSKSDVEFYNKNNK